MRYKLYLKIPGRDTEIIAVVEPRDEGEYSVLDHKLKGGLPLTDRKRPVAFISLPKGVSGLEELAEGAYISSKTPNHRSGGELDGCIYKGYEVYTPI